MNRTPRQLYELKRPVFFIGFMGAGKTTLTRKLARNLGLVSVDVDHYIERENGASIKQLYHEVGDEQFRRLEASALQLFAQSEPKLISCGGGVVCGAESRKIISEQGYTIYLYVSADESADRISNHDTRPFFETMDSVREVNAARVPVYEDLADWTIDTTGRHPGSVASEVTRVLIQEGVLCPLQK